MKNKAENVTERCVVGVTVCTSKIQKIKKKLLGIVNQPSIEIKT